MILGQEWMNMEIHCLYIQKEVEVKYIYQKINFKNNIMYIDLEDNLTKKYYKEIVEKAILIAKEIEATPSLSVYKSILNQLNDIKQSVVEEHIVFSEEEAQQRYSLGQIAIRYFDGYEEFEYADILIDIAYGVPLYPNMLEQ